MRSHSSTAGTTKTTLTVWRTAATCTAQNSTGRMPNSAPKRGTLQNRLWQGMEQLRQMRADPCFAPDAWVTTWDSHNPGVLALVRKRGEETLVGLFNFTEYPAGSQSGRSGRRVSHPGGHFHLAGRCGAGTVSGAAGKKQISKKTSPSDSLFSPKFFLSFSCKLPKVACSQKFAFAKRSGATKAPVGLLSDRTVLRSKMEGPRPDKFTFVDGCLPAMPISAAHP